MRVYLCFLLLLALVFPKLSLSGRRVFAKANSSSVDITAVKKCLQNKKLNFVGNSVSRGRAFAFRALMTGTESIDREEEKRLCGKDVDSQSKYRVCGGVFENQEYNISAIHSYVDTVYSTHMQSVLDLHVDLLIINVGAPYIHVHSWNIDDKNSTLANSPMFQEMATLAQRVNMLPINVEIWLFGATRLCLDKGVNGFDTISKIDDMNVQMRRLNKLMLSVFLTYVTSREIRYLDAWTTSDSCNNYADHVHSPFYANVTVKSWLGLHCDL